MTIESFVPKDFILFLKNQSEEMKSMLFQVHKKCQESIEHCRAAEFPDFNQIIRSSEKKCQLGGKRDTSLNCCTLGFDDKCLQQTTPLTILNPNYLSSIEPSIDEISCASATKYIDDEFETIKKYHNHLEPPSIDLSSIIEQIDLSAAAERIGLKTKIAEPIMTCNYSSHSMKTDSTRPKDLCNKVRNNDRLEEKEDKTKQNTNRFPVICNRNSKPPKIMTKLSDRLSTKGKLLKRSLMIAMAIKIQATVRGWLSRKHKLGAIVVAITCLAKIWSRRKLNLREILGGWRRYHLRRQRMRKRILFRVSSLRELNGNHLWYKKYLNISSYQALIPDWGKNEASNQYLATRRKASAFVRWMECVSKRRQSLLVCEENTSHCYRTLKNAL